MELLSQKPLYSNDPSTKGFDMSSGTMWIYPENYPLREYQFQIVQSALYHNTLVCLPTGLGKTFVAAVVMYNFWRWYPQGKIVFLAPTKPLVAQQINACHHIMGIPSDETIELTGTTDQKKRQGLWQENRVIFATPQVFQKDLEKNIVPSDRVKCVVVDEAHKALGKHSYCESIRLLSEQNQYFRVLALSATPGGKLEAVQEVVRNLHITHMELRDDQSPDIIPYINERKIDIVLVGLGAELERFKDRYVTIMDRHVRVLVENNVLRGFAGNISKGRIFHLQKDWQQKTNRGGKHGQIMKVLTILMTMYHAFDLMVRHGLRAFYNFYQNHMDKFWLSDEVDLLSLLEEINYFLGPFPDVRPMPDGTISEIPEDTRFGHNKFHKLKEILMRHFESFEDKDEETRAIVFVEYRDIVDEVYVLLLQSRPLIRPQKFVGQAGQKQKQQKIALEDFRSNKVNVLISTSVGEEGLDVGEVDLIVCFDISQNSPIRLVQRMGRTGRKRDGHIVVLVTDGKEHQTLRSTMSRRDSLNNKVLQSSGIINALHEESPRMVPAEFEPECRKMVMAVVPKTAPTKGKGKAKEPKKTRKRADTNVRAKNSKPSEPSTSKQAGSQSSLMKFLQKPVDCPQMEFLQKPMDRPQMEVDEVVVVPSTRSEIPSLFAPKNRATQSSQQDLKNNGAIKLSDIRLLSSDDAAVEFLTLCTMKKTEKEQVYVDESRTNPYLPSYYTNIGRYDDFFDFDVPDQRILDCLEEITECVIPSTEEENDDVISCVPSGQFNGCIDFRATPEMEILQETKFEALLDESSDDSAVFQAKGPQNMDVSMKEQVDWGENIDGLGFEELLDDWSDDGSKQSVEKNELKGSKPNELPFQPTHDLGFEDVLNFSSDDSYTDCNQQNESSKSETPDKTAATKNPIETTTAVECRGAFEEILNASDDSETDCDLPNENIKSKIPEAIIAVENPAEEKIAKVNPTTNDESKGAFEDILNTSSDGSETDCSLQLEPDAAADALDASGRKSATKRPNEIPIDSQSRDSLRSSKRPSTQGLSIDLEIDDSADLLADYKSQTLPQFSAAEGDKRNFQMFADPSQPSTSGVRKKSTPSQCSMLSLSQTLREMERIQSVGNKEESKINSEFEGETERSVSPVFPDRPRGTSLSSRLSGTSRREPARELILSRRENPVDEVAESEEDIFGADDLVVDSDLEAEICSIEKSVAQTADSVDKEKPRDDNKKEENIGASKINRINSNISGASGIKLSDSERSSEVTKNIRLSSRRSTTSEINLDDCDWDTEDVKNPTPPIVEESIAETSGVKKNFRPSSRRSTTSEINLDDCDWDSEDVKNPTPPIVKKSIAETSEVKKNFRPSSRRSTTSEINLDDCDWDSEDVKNPTPPIVKESIAETSGVTKNFRVSSRRSTTSEINLDDCDWDSEDVKNPTPPIVKESIAETSGVTKNFRVSSRRSTTSVTNLDDCDWDTEDVKNPTLPIVKESIAETADLDDCDWGSDFEAFNEPVKPSPSVKKIPEAPKNINNSVNSVDRLGGNIKKFNASGWISADKAKLKPVGKLARKLHKTLLTKRANEKRSAPPLNPDSDSENEFAVGRVETTVTKDLESDFFAKPDPVDKVTTSRSLGMSNARRIIRGPLSVRRNDANNSSINGLATFAAPTKYTQQIGAKKNLIVGAGRPKASSLDLDTRKKKKKRHRGERRTNRIRSEFIDDEAEVSTDSNCSSGSSGADDDLHDFVSYTQPADESIDMHAHYLQTVRSPRRAGGFHIRRPKSPSPGLEIYSQALPDEPNAYLYDSFCVAEDDDVFENSDTADEISLLDEIEMNLKNKKRKRVKSEDQRRSQKRRVVAPPAETSSSEDEFEKLRRQIHDESFVLRNRRE